MYYRTFLKETGFKGAFQLPPFEKLIFSYKNIK